MCAFHPTRGQRSSTHEPRERSSISARRRHPNTTRGILRGINVIVGAIQQSPSMASLSSQLAFIPSPLFSSQKMKKHARERARAAPRVCSPRPARHMYKHTPLSSSDPSQPCDCCWPAPSPSASAAAARCCAAISRSRSTSLMRAMDLRTCVYSCVCVFRFGSIALGRWIA